MTNPVLVEVTRGQIVESRHRGAVSVVDADGATVLSIGDVAQPVFPRSAVKAIQALPLIECGAADAYGFGARELALACASHSGEPAHAELAGAMLAKAGLGEADLECGTHWPFSEEAARAMAAGRRTPDQLHNNCSGKHAGFLCACRHLGLRHRGYVGAQHEWQRTIAGVMEEVTGAAHGEENRAVDGCSIPTFAVPLTALALGFARMAAGTSFGPARAAAARRAMDAAMAEPWFVAGTGRADTEIMTAGRGRVFVKTGAEGVYCAALPELGLGVALKCDDGATRASEAMVAAVLERLLPRDSELSEFLGSVADRPVPTRRGAEAGRVRAAGALARG